MESKYSIKAYFTVIEDNSAKTLFGELQEIIRKRRAFLRFFQTFQSLSEINMS